MTLYFKNILIAFFVFFISSCADLSYFASEGKDQVSIFWSAKNNSEILNDSNANEEVKTKIRLIQNVKNFFFNYFELKTKPIYEKTTLLDRDAVSWLVIASPKDKIEAREHCFLFMGCFPYLGFFDQLRANDFAKKLHSKNLVTWIRPVYAYSTLGYLNDPILSSFFVMDEYELIETIFHELFHTIYFIKNNVDLNESLAVYFGQEMTKSYFKSNNWPQKIQEYERILSFSERFNSFIMQKINILQLSYKNVATTNHSLSIYQEILQNFLNNVFFPEGKQLCLEYKMIEADCPFVQNGKQGEQWNNARFSAFLTYHENVDKIAEAHKKQGGTLKDFLHYFQSLSEKDLTQF